MAVHLRLIGTDPPGLTCNPSPDHTALHANIHVGVQRRQEVVDLSPGDQPATFDVTLDVRDARFAGPYVHGRGVDRFLYLSWGEVADGEFRMFRRAKIRLEHFDAMALDGLQVEGRFSLSDAKGNPTCASLTPPAIEWRVVD